MKRTWHQIDGQMVEVTPSPNLPSDLRFDGAFVSPVDGSVIRNRTELHDHNRRNNVVQQCSGKEQDIAGIKAANRDQVFGKAAKQRRIKAVRKAYKSQL